MKGFSGTAASILKAPIGTLGHVWYLIVSIPDPCTLTVLSKNKNHISSFITSLSAMTMRFHSDVVVHCG